MHFFAVRWCTINQLLSMFHVARPSFRQSGYGYLLLLEETTKIINLLSTPHFLAMMSFAGYFHARFLRSAFFPVCLSCFFLLFFPTVFVPDLFWCNFLYLVTTAGFVADQLIIANNMR